MFMNKLANSTFAIGFSELILLSVGLARNKYLAVTIGPEGFGVYSILNSFFLLISAFAGTWITTGTTKYIAQFSSKSDETKNKILQFSLIITIGLSLLLLIILGLWHEFFINFFMANKIEKFYYFIFMASFCWVNLSFVLLAALQGVVAIKYVVKSRYYISVIDVVSLIILVYFYNLTGFFLSLLITSVAAVIIQSYFVFKKCRFKIFRGTKIEKDENLLRKLLSFGSNNLLTALINLGSVYFQRYIILLSLGVNSVGIFQAGISIMTYLSSVSRGSLFHLLPSMSQELSKKERSANLNEYLFFVSITSLPVCAITILFGNDAIKLLFSEKFSMLNDIFYLFVISQMVIILASSFQITIVGLGRLKIHLLSVIIIHGTWIVVPFVFLSTYGIASAAWGIILGTVLGSIVYYTNLCSLIDYKISLKVIVILIINLLFTTLFVVINENNLLIKIFSLITYLLVIIINFDTDDRQKLSKYFKNKLF